MNALRFESDLAPECVVMSESSALRSSHMFIFSRSIFVPLAALAVSALFVLLDTLSKVGAP